MLSMGNSYEQSREFVPAGFTDVQSSYNLPPQPSRRTEPRPEPIPEAAPQPYERPLSNAEQARQINDYLEHIGARIDATRRDETSGVATTGHQSGYGIVG